MGVSGQLLAPTTLLPGEEPVAAVEWEAGWVADMVRMFWTKQDSATPAGNWFISFQHMS